MSLPEMQACLSRLYIDTTFRRLVEIAPNEALTDYRLTAEERAAVLALDQAALERFARALLLKRRRRLASAYPLTFEHFRGPILDRYFRRYYDLHPAEPNEDILNTGIQLGRFLEECLAVDPDVPPYAAELVRYERCHLTAYLTASADQWGPGMAPSPFPFDARPALVPGVQYSVFRYDVLAIAQTLRAKETLPEPAPSPHYLIFRIDPKTRRPRVLRATVDTLALLDLCDGRRTLDDVVEAYEYQNNETGIRAEIQWAITDLCAQTVLQALPARS